MKTRESWTETAFENTTAPPVCIISILGWVPLPGVLYPAALGGPALLDSFSLHCDIDRLRKTMRKNCSRTCPATCSTSSFNIFQLLSYPMDPMASMPMYAQSLSMPALLHSRFEAVGLQKGRPSDSVGSAWTIYELRKTRAVLRKLLALWILV